MNWLNCAANSELEAFKCCYDVDPMMVVFSTEDDAMFGKLRMPIYSAVLGWLDIDPEFDVAEYVQQWKEYWQEVSKDNA